MRTRLLERLEAKLIVVARIVLGLVFLSASLHKIVDPGSFARAMANYRLLPAELVNFFAVVIPWVELLCGVLLLLGQWVRTCSLLVSCMLVVFVVAVGAGWTFTAGALAGIPADRSASGSSLRMLFTWCCPSFWLSGEERKPVDGCGLGLSPGSNARRSVLLRRQLRMLWLIEKETSDEVFQAASVRSADVLLKRGVRAECRTQVGEVFP